MLSSDSRFSAPRPARRAIASRERAWHARCARTIGVLSRARDFAHARAGGAGACASPHPPARERVKCACKRGGRAARKSGKDVLPCEAHSRRMRHAHGTHARDWAS